MIVFQDFKFLVTIGTKIENIHKNVLQNTGILDLSAKQGFQRLLQILGLWQK